MEDITVNTAAGRHRITLDGRKQCKVTGVTDVLSFDEGAVLLETVDGMLMIKGEGLHVSRINLDKGEADIDGKADSFVYSERTSLAKKGEGLLTRLCG